MLKINAPKKLNRSLSFVTNISYHIIWIPKYRKKLLVDAVEIKLKKLLYSKAVQLNVVIKAIECMPDHIHIFLCSNPKFSISYIVKILKGYTSYYLRKEFLILKKYKSLWTPSYYCETIGHINEKTIIKYINDQKNH